MGILCPSLVAGFLPTGIPSVQVRDADSKYLTKTISDISDFPKAISSETQLAERPASLSEIKSGANLGTTVQQSSPDAVQLLPNKYSTKQYGPQPQSVTPQKLAKEIPSDKVGASGNSLQKTVPVSKPDSPSQTITSTQSKEIPTVQQSAGTDSKSSPQLEKQILNSTSDSTTHPTVSSFIDKPTEEEIQATIASFRDNTDALFDRYRIRSRNGVADTPEKVFDWSQDTTEFSESNIVAFVPVLDIKNILNPKDFQMPFIIGSQESHSDISDIVSHLGIKVQFDIANAMFSRDTLKYIGELNDSTISSAPDYSGKKESIWFSWIWGAIALGTLLLSILLWGLYKVIAWYRSEEYNMIQTVHSDEGTDVLMPTTSELFAEIYSPQEQTEKDARRKNEYVGIDMFIDRRIQ